MFSKTVVIASLVALATARFGQENLVQDKIAALSGFGAPGQAATLASQSPRVLLDGASACDKVSKWPPSPLLPVIPRPHARSQTLIRRAL